MNWNEVETTRQISPRVELHKYWTALARDEYIENKHRIPMSEECYVFQAVKYLGEAYEHEKRNNERRIQ